MITSQQYVQVNDSLNQLQTVLGELGIVEFIISQRQHSVSWHLDKDIDPQLLESFCTAVRKIGEKGDRIDIVPDNECVMVA